MCEFKVVDGMLRFIFCDLNPVVFSGRRHHYVEFHVDIAEQVISYSYDSDERNLQKICVIRGYRFVREGMLGLEIVDGDRGIFSHFNIGKFAKQMITLHGETSVIFARLLIV